MTDKKTLVLDMIKSNSDFKKTRYVLTYFKNNKISHGYGYDFYYSVMDHIDMDGNKDFLVFDTKINEFVRITKF